MVAIAFIAGTVIGAFVGIAVVALCIVCGGKDTDNQVNITKGKQDDNGG